MENGNTRGLTPAQRRLYAKLQELEREGADPPSLPELCLQLGVRSRGSLHKQLSALVEAGLVKPMNGLSRGVQLANAGPLNITELPLLGRIAAGRPIEARLDNETVAVPEQLLPPGNAYVLHSISEMIRQARKRRGAFGLVTANGNYITKHSWGIYSTTPNAAPWQREEPKRLQAELDALPKAPFTETPSGAARIESYTVMYGKKGAEFGIVIGREDATGRRFLSNVPNDPAALADLQDKEGLGRPGTVTRDGDRNLFVPE